MSRGGLAAAAAVIAGLLLTVGLPVASADDDRSEARATGNCSAGSAWRLRAEADDGRVEVRLRVRGRTGGGSWTYTLRDEGAVVAAGSRSSGIGRLRVRRSIADGPGVRTLTATARNAASREYCRAAVRV